MKKTYLMKESELMDELNCEWFDYSRTNSNGYTEYQLYEMLGWDFMGVDPYYSAKSFSPDSMVEGVVYLMKYKSSKKEFYKIGICAFTLLETRKSTLQRSVNKYFSKEDFVVTIEDYISVKNKSVARRIESTFKGYYRLRYQVELKKKRSIKLDGHTELYKHGIIKKWDFYKKNKKYDQSGLIQRKIFALNRKGYPSAYP